MQRMAGQWNYRRIDKVVFFYMQSLFHALLTPHSYSLSYTLTKEDELVCSNPYHPRTSSIFLCPMAGARIEYNVKVYLICRPIEGVKQTEILTLNLCSNNLNLSLSLSLSVSISPSLYIYIYIHLSFPTCLSSHMYSTSSLSLPLRLFLSISIHMSLFISLASSRFLSLFPSLSVCYSLSFRSGVQMAWKSPCLPNCHFSVTIMLEYQSH